MAAIRPNVKPALSSLVAPQADGLRRSRDLRQAVRGRGAGRPPAESGAHPRARTAPGNRFPCAFIGVRFRTDACPSADFLAPAEASGSGANLVVDDGRTIFQPTSAGSVKPGTCLNGIYEIEKLIAQGGMGEVYRGFNIQTRDIVAIKMIRPELSNNPDVFDLFRREASILYTLQHEAIVRYFVFSVDPQLRRAYLAMEFVDGPSLADKLVSGPLSLAEVNVLRLRVSSALEAAHGRGVVHRDISSDNVIFPNGEVRSAKIIDFGIARSLREGEGTIIGSGFAGKYNYVSPEQLGLAGGEVTYKSDIYSFGLVLAEALRGRAHRHVRISSGNH